MNPEGKTREIVGTHVATAEIGDRKLVLTLAPHREGSVPTGFLYLKHADRTGATIVNFLGVLRPPGIRRLIVALNELTARLDDAPAERQPGVVPPRSSVKSCYRSAHVPPRPHTPGVPLDGKRVAP